MSVVSSRISSMKAARESSPRSIWRSLCSHSPVSSGLVSVSASQIAEQRDERDALGGDDELAALADEVAFEEQALR